MGAAAAGCSSVNESSDCVSTPADVRPAAAAPLTPFEAEETRGEAAFAGCRSAGCAQRAGQQLVGTVSGNMQALHGSAVVRR